MIGVDAEGCNCEIAGAGGYVQYLFWRNGSCGSDGFFAPAFVDAHGQKVIEKVVSAGDIIEHLSNLNFLA
jgi:hypothetical protein